MLLGQKMHKEFYLIFDDEKQIKKIKENNKVFFSNEFSVKDDNLIDFKQNVEHIIIDDRWFYIDYSKCKDTVNMGIKEYFKKLDSAGELPDLTQQHLSNVDLMIYGEKKADKWIINFQSIGRGSRIKSKDSLLIKRDSIVYEHREDVLEFKNFRDIHIDEKKERIYFKRFSDLKKLHKDFILLYKEATQQEVNDFVKDISNISLFEINDKIRPLERNLKKIKLILDEGRIEILKKEKDVKKYIKKYDISLKLIKKKYIVKDNVDLTNLIKIIDESYYESEITKEKRETNNIIKLT